MDGYELARQLRQELDHQELHLIAMTGYGRAEDRLAAHTAGFDTHMVKPADIEELQWVIGSGRMPAGS